jgi:hypothetical protein
MERGRKGERRKLIQVYIRPKYIIYMDKMS